MHNGFLKLMGDFGDIENDYFPKHIFEAHFKEVTEKIRIWFEGFL